MNIGDIVSPGDQKLVDLVTPLLNSIISVLDIFVDRNNSQVTASFAYAIIASMIEGLTGKDIPNADLIDFLMKYEAKDV